MGSGYSFEPDTKKSSSAKARKGVKAPKAKAPKKAKGAKKSDAPVDPPADQAGDKS